MIYEQTTQVPNILFDTYLHTLTGSEMKVLFIIVRQTYGWIDPRTRQRKVRDWISYEQFMKKTGLSRRVISQTVKSLVEKKLIQVTCRNGNLLHQAEKRRGVVRMFYSFQREPVKPRAQPLKMHGVRQIGEVIKSPLGYKYGDQGNQR